MTELIQFQNFEKVRFVFKTLDKVVVMDINTKLALEDFKYTFSQILKVELFGKSLQFTYKIENNSEVVINSALSLSNAQIPKKCRDAKHSILEINVRFIEEGA